MQHQGGFCLNGAGQRNCGPDNPLDINNDRGLSDTDVRHRVSIASVYELPIGRGRLFFGNMPKSLDYVIGGWQLNNIVNLQSGPVYDVQFNGGRVEYYRRPDADGAAASRRKTIEYQRFPSCSNAHFYE